VFSVASYRQHKINAMKILASRANSENTYLQMAERSKHVTDAEVVLTEINTTRNIKHDAKIHYLKELHML
jgi:hypothetical protein